MTKAEQVLSEIVAAIKAQGGKVKGSGEYYTNPEGKSVCISYSFTIEFDDESTIYDTDFEEAANE